MFDLFFRTDPVKEQLEKDICLKKEKLEKELWNEIYNFKFDKRQVCFYVFLEILNKNPDMSKNILAELCTHFLYDDKHERDCLARIININSNFKADVNEKIQILEDKYKIATDKILENSDLSESEKNSVVGQIRAHMTIIAGCSARVR